MIVCSTLRLRQGLSSAKRAEIAYFIAVTVRIAKPQYQVSPKVDQAASVCASSPFILPPPLKHVTEGSFFVNDRDICQMIDGKAEPVTYCGTRWHTDGTPQARKAHYLIKLVILTRRVLQSLNEGVTVHAPSSSEGAGCFA